MRHIHKRFPAEQVEVLLKGYHQGISDRLPIEEILDINKTRFCALLRQYRRNPENFSISYERETPTRLSVSIEKEWENQMVQSVTYPLKEFPGVHF